MRRYYIQKRYLHDTQWQRVYALKGFFIRSHAIGACDALSQANHPQGIISPDYLEYRVWDDKEKVAL